MQANYPEQEKIALDPSELVVEIGGEHFFLPKGMPTRPTSNSGSNGNEPNQADRLSGSVASNEPQVKPAVRITVTTDAHTDGHVQLQSHSKLHDIDGPISPAHSNFLGYNLPSPMGSVAEPSMSANSRFIDDLLGDLSAEHSRDGDPNDS